MCKVSSMSDQIRLEEYVLGMGQRGNLPDTEDAPTKRRLEEFEFVKGTGQL